MSLRVLCHTDGQSKKQQSTRQKTWKLHNWRISPSLYRHSSFFCPSTMLMIQKMDLQHMLWEQLYLLSKTFPDPFSERTVFKGSSFHKKTLSHMKTTSNCCNCLHNRPIQHNRTSSKDLYPRPWIAPKTILFSSHYHDIIQILWRE